MITETFKRWARKMTGLAGPRTIGGIEIDEDIVKLVYAREGGDAPDIQQLVIRKTAPCSADEENSADTEPAPNAGTATLREIIDTHSIRPDVWRAAVPAHLCITKHITLPSVDDEELSRMIRNHAITLLPLDEDEIVYDHRILHRSPEGYSFIELALIKRNTVEEYVSMINNAGIELDAVTTANESLLMYNHAGDTGIPTPAGEAHLDSGGAENDADTIARGEDHAQLFIDIDFHRTTMIVAKSGRPVFTRTLHTGADTVQGESSTSQLDTSWIESLAEHIRASLKPVLQREANAGAISHAYISGAEALCEASRSIISRTLAVPVTIRDNDGLQLDREILLIDDSTPLKNVSVSSILGLLSFSGGVPIDLMPPAVVSARRSRRTKNALSIAALLIAVILVLSAIIFYNSIDRRKQYLSFLNEEIGKTRATALDLSRKQDKVQLINEHLARGRMILEVLTEVYRIIPPNIKLTQMSCDESGIIIKGEAPEMSHVIDLTPILEQSPLFENARVKYATRTQRTRNAINFEITLGTR